MTVSLSIIRSFSLYTQQWYMSYSLWAGSGRSVLILLASCMTYTTAVCAVKDSWWWTEELSETWRVLFQKQIWEISASSWLYYKNLSRCTVTWTSEKTPGPTWFGPHVVGKRAICPEAMPTLCSKSCVSQCTWACEGRTRDTEAHSFSCIDKTEKKAS